jgi:hypothetical protein
MLVISQSSGRETKFGGFDDLAEITQITGIFTPTDPMSSS